MKRILLIALNARYSHSNPGLRYLRAAAEDLSLHVTIRDFSINQKEEEITAYIAETKPDVIGFSVYIWNSAMVQDLIEDPALRGIPLLLGGPEVSYTPEEWLKKYPAVTWIICGPGEGPFRELAASGFSLPRGKVDAPPLHFDDVPFPWQKKEIEKLNHRYIYYEASRGCPFHCSYCLSSRRDQPLELRSIEKVKDELLLMVDAGAETIKFVDRSFNADRKFARRIWKFCIETFSPEKVRFHFEVFPALLENADFQLLADAPDGLFQFEIGVQSIHETTLREINRPGSWDIVKKNIQRLIEKKNIHIHVDLIAGLPGDDMSRLRASFNELFQLGADHLQLGFLKVLPGTVMAEKTGHYGIIHENDAPYTITENRWLQGNDIIRLQAMARLLDIYVNSHKFSLTASEIFLQGTDPFGILESMALFDKGGKLTRPAGDSWERRADFLLRFAAETFPEKENFFRDTLCHDWISLTGRHRFPSVLDRDSRLAKGRKAIIQALTESSDKGKCVIQKISCPVNELRRAVIFLPSTREFREKYLAGREGLFLLPPMKKPLTFMKDDILKNKKKPV